MPTCINLELVHAPSLRRGYCGALLSLAVPAYRLNPPVPFIMCIMYTQAIGRRFTGKYKFCSRPKSIRVGLSPARLDSHSEFEGNAYVDMA